MENIKSLKNWISNSGIQNKDGSFNSWYDRGTKRYPSIYPEITGYGINTLLNMGQLKKAELAGKWIIEKAIHPIGAVRTHHYLLDVDRDDWYSFEKGKVYVFDTAMALFGISNLFEATSDKKYHIAMINMADFITKMQNIDGGFFPYHDPIKKEKGTKNDKWSNQPGSFHAKAVFGLLKAYQFTNNETYKKCAKAICEFALTQQDESGRFITSSLGDKSTNQHPHCYSAEGLFYAGIKFDEPEYMNAAIKAIKWSINSQNKDGGIPQIYDGKNFVSDERSDVLAQVLRMGLIINDHKQKEIIPKTKLDRLKERMLYFQNKVGPQEGGMFYGFENYTMFFHVNSWCSMFALQALNFYDRNKIEEEIFV